MGPGVPPHLEKPQVPDFPFKPMESPPKEGSHLVRSGQAPPLPPQPPFVPRDLNPVPKDAKRDLQAEAASHTSQNIRILSPGKWIFQTFLGGIFGIFIRPEGTLRAK